MAIITKIEENKAVIGKKKVAAYCRVSTDQDDQLLSLETQKAHYESWIQGHSDWEYAGLYYDEGLSGTKMDTRPSLLRMMEDCKHGLIDYVITKSVSRLARNTADFLTIVRTLLDLGIPIYFEKENIDTGSMENELMLSIMSSIAESESVSISENNKWSIQRKFKNGTYKCSYPPYGYDWDKKNGEMVVNPEQAEIVRYIFAQTLAGVGTHDIAKDLMAKGVPTKKGGKWTGHTVNGIIRNEKYTGDCLFQKTYTDSSFVRRRNLGELDQYYVEDHHEAIISREDYEAANDVIDRRRQEKGIELDNGKYQNRYPLSGKVICGECGGTFKRKTYTHKVVLACTQHIDDKEKCSMKYVDLEAVEVAFATMMNRLVYGRNKVLRPFYEALQQSNQTEALLKIHDIQEQLDALVEKKQTIKGLFAKGVIEPAVYTQSLNGVTAEVERLTTEKDALSYIASSEISHIEETRKLLSFADKGEFLDGFDGEIFETYVDRIVVKSQTELEFQMKCGLNLIERI